MYSINQNKCMGCGVCARVCPEGIKMVNGKAEIENQQATCLEEAMEVCPVKIIVNDKK